jgi:hypothetical protein
MFSHHQDLIVVGTGALLGATYTHSLSMQNLTRKDLERFLVEFEKQLLDQITSSINVQRGTTLLIQRPLALKSHTCCWMR